MLLRGIAFAEARRNSARRVFKSRDKTQGNGCGDKDAADLTSHDGPRQTRKAMMVYRPAEEPLSPVFPITFVSCDQKAAFEFRTRDGGR